MASITIRDLDLAVKKRIKLLAVTHGRSMEAEARDILTRAAAVQRPPKNLARSIHKRFAKLEDDGFTLLADELPPDPMRFE